MDNDDSVTGPRVTKKVGRPKKAAVAAKKVGTKGRAVGRPKGDAAIMAEYRARLLASPRSRKVLDAILTAALDHEHKHQAAAWKIIADRILPVAQFETLTGSSSKPTITINISGVSDSGVSVSSEKDIEGDYDIID